MEESSGIVLVNRLPRGVVMTEAGEALAHYARLMLHQQKIMTAEIYSLVQELQNNITLYVNSAALTEFLPSKLAPWLALNPDVCIELKECTSTDIIRTITTGLGDVGIISDAVDTMDLELSRIIKDHLVLLVPKAHHLTERARSFLIMC